VATDSPFAWEGTMKIVEGRVFTARDAGALSLELNGKTLALVGLPRPEAAATLTRESLKATTRDDN
jgi:hypothetical protein